MKLLRNLFMTAAMGGMLFACNTDVMTPEGQIGGGAAVGVYTASTCTEVCIEPGSGDYYTKTDQFSGSIGGNAKYITYTAYNTETDFVVILTYTRTNGSNSPTVKVTVNGVEQTKVLTYNTAITYTFPLAEGWAACDETSFALTEVTDNGVKLFDGQNPITGSSIYKLVGVCEPSCELEGESFTVSNEGGCDASRDVTYTFSSEEGVSSYKIQGGLTAFTSGEPTVSVAGGGTVSKREVGNGNWIITVEGSLEACSTVEVTVSWTSTNGDPDITGEWTVVDAEGAELAEAIAPVNCN